MSAQDFGVVAILIPDPQFAVSNGARIVNDAYGFSLRASGVIRTLSTNNPRRSDMVEGLLYHPDLPDDTPCSNATLSLVPSNVTTRAEIPLGNFPLVALAPWSDPECVQSYLEVMRFDNVRAGIFFHPDNSSDRPPPDNDASWDLQDNGKWRTDNQYPVYAVPGMMGAFLLDEMALYSGNLTEVPYGDQLSQIYSANDTVRLYTRMDVGQSSGIPQLWVFLIIVLAILLAVVLSTSVLMHLVQRRQRRLLQRRVANGDVDLEALGIKRLNVPQDILDKMPQYTYTSKPEELAQTENATDKDTKSDMSGTAAAAASLSTTRQVHFTQPTCPICLEDFIHNETTIRELPCNHIFHPECIDPFLRENSSLCPMCKKSSLPAGYCPVVVTNLMVRRERLVRRMRQRRINEAGMAASNPDSQPAPGASLRDTVRRMSTPLNGGNGPHSSAGGANGPASELQPMSTRRMTVINEDEMPPEIRAQGVSARRAWRRERIAQNQARRYDEQADETRAADVSRPFWRRTVGRVFPRFE